MAQSATSNPSIPTIKIFADFYRPEINFCRTSDSTDPMILPALGAESRDPSRETSRIWEFTRKIEEFGRISKIFNKSEPAGSPNPLYFLWFYWFLLIFIDFHWFPMGPGDFGSKIGYFSKMGGRGTKVENQSFRQRTELPARIWETEVALESYPTTSLRSPPFLVAEGGEEGAKSAEAGAKVGVDLP